MIRYDPYDENILIVGSSGTGKSTLLKFLLSNLSSTIKFWLWDYNWQHNFASVVRRLDALSYNSLIYQPLEKSEEEFSEFCYRALKMRNLVVAVEEVQEYGNKWRLVENFERIVRAGRNFGVTYIAVTQRPSEVHNAILSNSHHRFIFRLNLPSDVEYIEKWTGISRENIQRLPNFHFYYHNAKTGEYIKFKPIRATFI